jgi:hypothetical protein
MWCPSFGRHICLVLFLALHFITLKLRQNSSIILFFATPYIALESREYSSIVLFFVPKPINLECIRYPSMLPFCTAQTIAFKLRHRSQDLSPLFVKSPNLTRRLDHMEAYRMLDRAIHNTRK